MVKAQCYSKLPNRTRNDKKVKFAFFFNSPEYKMHKMKRFFSVNTKRAVKISADTLVLRTHDYIDFSPHLTKYTYLAFIINSK